MMTDKEIVDTLVERAKELGWRVKRVPHRSYDGKSHYCYYLYPPSGDSFAVYSCCGTGIHLMLDGWWRGDEYKAFFRQLTGHEFPPTSLYDCITVPLSIMNGMVWTTGASNG